MSEIIFKEPLFDRSAIQVIKAVLLTRLRIMTRYKGWLFVSIFIPLIFSALPILMGTAVAGGFDKAAINFERNVGTKNFILFSLIGTALWLLASGLMWDFGMWIREEQQQGTLEQNLVAPINVLWIVVGSGLSSLILISFQFIAVLVLGGLVYNVFWDLLTPGILLAIVFLVLGMIPLMGISLLIGSIIIKFKEANALLNLLQPIFAFLMGIFYPITILPELVRLIAIALPLTIATNDIRAAILNTQYVFNIWIDLAFVGFFAIFWPLIGLMVFKKTEAKARKTGSLSSY
ncbi:MAG: ABC transporter permease [Candidatus Asgardarchaeia archaeon]